MNRLARFLRSRRFRAAVVLPLFLGCFLAAVWNTARACWTDILVECFAHPINTWPWDPPGEGNWRVCSVVGGQTFCFPNLPATYSRWWPNASNYYDVTICPDDDRSLWCYGYPLNHDPDFDVYPANYDTYVVFGPFSLADATACQVIFHLFHRAEQNHDTLFWGASTAYPLSNASMKIDSVERTDTPNGWEVRVMDLSDLTDFTTGDSASMIGEQTVYVFWRFRSDANAVRDKGSFIDNVVIARDDGLMDAKPFPFPSSVQVFHPDTTFVQEPVRVGDTLFARYGWSLCDGGVGDYPPFHVMLTAGDQVVVDTLVANGHSGDEVVLFSPPWVATQYGEFFARLTVDTLNEITEGNEGNNVDTMSYNVLPINPPPDFVWIAPGSPDTLWADSSVTLRWSQSDPDEPSWASIYYAINPTSCNGTIVPGGSDRPALEGPDSLVWNTLFLPNHRTYYIFAQVTDSENDTCIYAAWPVFTCHGFGCPTQDAENPGVNVPETYFLSQNYPNPFNPRTEIRYGVTKAGHVTLRVYDLLGREQAKLVDESAAPGSYTVTFDGTRLPSGLYFYVLDAPEGTLRQKMMLLK